MVTVAELITVSWDHIMRMEKKPYVKSAIVRPTDGGYKFYVIDPETLNEIPCHWTSEENVAGEDKDRIAFVQTLILNCIHSLDSLLEDMRG